MNSDKPVANETKNTQSLHDHALDSLLPLLACPECRGDLARQGGGLTCQSCSRSYEVADGIPLLAQAGSSELWGVESDSQTSTAYQETFLDATIGERYQQRYERRWSKRFTTRREIGRIEQLLMSQPRCHRLLDIPCGGGRVSGPLVNATDLLLQADISLSQVLTARQTMGSPGSFAWLTASAFLIPLKEGVVDGILCNRLAHHLAGVEQERLIGELLRVSKRFVIMSYYDHDSFKSRGRRLRGKKPGYTLRRSDLAAMARRHGASVAMDLPLWVEGSRLRYALLLKNLD
ncbi:MAG: SAM-dependent methyltransferase [Deltaproteobacteria bacterium]|nr:SAM-dependent methyltransferase [Deltaproteobacteria bacterium]